MSHSGAERVIVERERVIVEWEASHSGVGRFWNLPQYKLYKLGFLGAGCVISYSKKRKGFVTLPPS